jgi:hypothetical protein
MRTMKGEITDELYCSGFLVERDGDEVTCEYATSSLYLGNGVPDFCGDCPALCRKFPTQDEYRAKFGEDWKGAMYAKCKAETCRFPDEKTKCMYSDWAIYVPFLEDAGLCTGDLDLRCACTPWSLPVGK